mgnify:CR=1 FL=1
MDISITTPALLFPAISVLFLAYANRFLAIANRIRELHDRFKKSQSPLTKKQIGSLKRRIQLIIAMQILAVAGIISCILTMALIYAGMQSVANIIFIVAMVLIVLSLLTSITELWISTKALNFELEDMDEG